MLRFLDYYNYRESVDPAAAFNGSKMSDPEGGPGDPVFMEVAKLIWKLDQPGMMRFFNTYRHNADAKEVGIQEMLDQLEKEDNSSRNTSPSPNRQHVSDKPMVVAPTADAGNGEAPSDH